jgi:hypothetical protein
VNFVSLVLDTHINTNFVSDEELTIEEVLKAADWAQRYSQELLSSNNEFKA